MAGAARRRLAGTGAFDRVFRGGARRDGEYLQIVFIDAAPGSGRAGLVIGRAALPRAVDRNRVRRMLREVLRRARPAIDGYDVILRLRKRVPRSAFPQVAAEAARLVATISSCARPT